MEGVLVVQSESEFGQWESDQVAALTGDSPVGVTASLPVTPDLMANEE
jgi:hypothetical protein